MRLTWKKGGLTYQKTKNHLDEKKQRQSSKQRQHKFFIEEQEDQFHVTAIDMKNRGKNSF